MLCWGQIVQHGNTWHHGGDNWIVSIVPSFLDCRPAFSVLLGCHSTKLWQMRSRRPCLCMRVQWPTWRHGKLWVRGVHREHCINTSNALSFCVCLYCLLSSHHTRFQLAWLYWQSPFSCVQDDSVWFFLAEKLPLKTSEGCSGCSVNGTKQWGCAPVQTTWLRSFRKTFWRIVPFRLFWLLLVSVVVM